MHFLHEPIRVYFCLGVQGIKSGKDPTQGTGRKPKRDHWKGSWVRFQNREFLSLLFNDSAFLLSIHRMRTLGLGGTEATVALPL